MSGLQKLLCLIMVVGVLCVFLQSRAERDQQQPPPDVKKQNKKRKQEGKKSVLGGVLVLKIRNKYPSRATFSMAVNGRKLISAFNPTEKGQTFVLPLRHHHPLKTVEITKHTSKYGALYIDQFEAYETSIIPKLIFTGRDIDASEDVNLFQNDAVRWSELCTSGILVHQGRYLFKPSHFDCPFLPQ